MFFKIMLKSLLAFENYTRFIKIMQKLYFYFLLLIW